VQLQDLQQQLDALDRQVATLGARIAHITALLAAPDLTAERRAQLEARRAELQTTLRRAHRERAGTAQQAALATIQLTLATKQQSGTPAPASRWRRSLDEAGRILAWEGIAMLYALAVVVPFGALGGLAWLGTRARRRGVERRLLARAP
jgi:multidrug resistance efflux pump